MTVISKLKLSEKQRSDEIRSPEQRLRGKLIDRLIEQKELAEADLKGEPLVKTRFKFIQDPASGENKRIEVPKMIRRWWWKDEAETVFLQLRYGNKPLEVADKKPTIEVGTLDKLPKIIDTVMEAVKAGELDKQLRAAVSERRAKLKRVS